MARPSLASVDPFLLPGPILASNKLFEGFLVHYVVSVPSTSASYLKHWLAIPVDHLISSYLVLRPPQVGAIAGQVPRSFHPICGEAVPDSGLQHPPLGQKPLELDHSLPLVEGGAHIDHNRPCVHPAGGLGVRKEDPVHCTIHLNVF